jgi:hypothetical protein
MRTCPPANHTATQIRQQMIIAFRPFIISKKNLLNLDPGAIMQTLRDI